MNEYTEQICRNIALKLQAKPGTKAFDDLCDRYRPLSDVKDPVKAGGLGCAVWAEVTELNDSSYDNSIPNGEYLDTHDILVRHANGIAVSMHIDAMFREDGVAIGRGKTYCMDDSQTVRGLEDPTSTDDVMWYYYTDDLASMEDPKLISDEQALILEEVQLFEDDEFDHSWFVNQYNRAELYDRQVLPRPQGLGTGIVYPGALSLETLEVVSSNREIDHKGVDEVWEASRQKGWYDRRGRTRPVRSNSGNREPAAMEKFMCAVHDSHPSVLKRWIHLGGFRHVITKPYKGIRRNYFHDRKGYVFTSAGFLPFKTVGAHSPELPLSCMTTVPVSAGYNRKERRFKWFGRNLKIVGKDKPSDDTFTIRLTDLMTIITGDVEEVLGTTEFSTPCVRPLGTAFINWSDRESVNLIRPSVYPVTSKIALAVASSSSGGRNVKRLFRAHQRRQTGSVHITSSVKVPKEAMLSFFEDSRGKAFIEAGAPEPVLNLSAKKLEALRRKILNHVLEEKVSLFILEQA